MSEAPPLVCVVDDDDAVREAVCHLLAGLGMEVRGYAGCRPFLKDTSAHDADCLILDVRLPDGNGLGLHEQLTAAGAPPPVVFISGVGDIPMVVQAMRQGALDFLEKPFGSQALLDRVHEAVAIAAVRRQQRAGRAAIEARLAQLTPRERDVLRHLRLGCSSKDMAKILAISVRTVEHHRARVMAKMQSASLPALTQMLTGFDI